MRFSTLAPGLLLLGATLSGLSGCTDQAANATAGQMELSSLVAYWAVRGQDSEGNNYIFPSVRFRLRNGSEAPVEYVQVMSVFRRESAPDEAWGTGYLHSAHEAPLAPAEESQEHILRADSNYLSQGTPERMFQNPLWEDVEVEVFVRVGASSWVSRGRTTALRRLGAPGVDKYLEPDEDEPIYEDAAALEREGDETEDPEPDPEP